MTLLMPTSVTAVARGGTYLFDRGPNHRPRYHQGVDLLVNYEPIYASGAGVVTGVYNTGRTSGFGLYVDVLYGTVLVRCAHMSAVNVTVGQKVTATTRLGTSGGARGAFGAGASTGPHLHLEVRVNGAHKDPALYLTSRTGTAGGGTPVEKKRKRPMIYIRHADHHGGTLWVKADEATGDYEKTTNQKTANRWAEWLGPSEKITSTGLEELYHHLDSRRAKYLADVAAAAKGSPADLGPLLDAIKGIKFPTKVTGSLS